MKIRIFSFLVVLALLGGCRAAGPSTPARTVAEFFRKYDGRPGFKTTDWSAGLTTRLLLGRIAKLGGDNDISQALTAIRSFKVITFTPTSSGAMKLADEGLEREVTSLLANEKYTPLTVTAPDNSSTALRYSVRQQGDRVQELVATGRVNDAPDSFMLVDIAGNFTTEQVNQLVKFLPGTVGELGR